MKEKVHCIYTVHCMVEPQNERHSTKLVKYKRFWIGFYRKDISDVSLFTNIPTIELLVKQRILLLTVLNI